MIYHVTCNTDDNYAQHCCAMLCSLFENNKEYKFHIHILTHTLSSEHSEEINKLCRRYNSELSVHDVDESKLDGVKFRKNRPLTKAAYYRVLIPEVLDETIERILYLDCDMIIVGDVKELFDLELDGYALAATKDLLLSPDHRHQLQLGTDEITFCSGIMMINLRFWRQNNSVDKLVNFSKRDRSPVYYHDQDSLNYVFKGKWLMLPPKWNKPALSYLPIVNGLLYADIYEYVYEPKVIHFSSDAKPWFNISFPYSKLYREYLSKSCFQNPKFQKVNFRKKIRFEIMNLRYYIRKNIVPFIPQIIIVLLFDIFKLVKLPLSFLQNDKKKQFVLREGIKAVKIFN